MNEPTLIDTKTSEADARAKEIRELCQGLRDVADLFEQHPGCIRHPYSAGMTVNVFLRSKEELIEATRGIGLLKKVACENFFFFRRDFGGGVSVDFNVRRDAVCERVVTKKVLPAEPEKIVTIEARPEREVETVEWRCPDSLLAESAR